MPNPITNPPVPSPVRPSAAASKKINLFQHSHEFESYAAGHTIFREGDAADRMYVVIEGSVEVTIGGRSVRLVEAGDPLGEMALIDEASRSATATALTGCRLAPITSRRFQFLVQQSPVFALQLMRVMSERLRQRDH